MASNWSSKTRISNNSMPGTFLNIFLKLTLLVGPKVKKVSFKVPPEYAVKRQLILMNLTLALSTPPSNIALASFRLPSFLAPKNFRNFLIAGISLSVTEPFAAAACASSAKVWACTGWALNVTSSIKAAKTASQRFLITNILEMVTYVRAVIDITASPPDYPQFKSTDQTSPKCPGFVWVAY